MAEVLDTLEPNFSLSKVLLPPFENAYLQQWFATRSIFIPGESLQHLKTCLIVVTAGWGVKRDVPGGCGMKPEMLLHVLLHAGQTLTVKDHLVSCQSH